MFKFLKRKRKFIPRSIWLEGVLTAEKYLKEGKWEIVDKMDHKVTFRNKEFGGLSGYETSRFTPRDGFLKGIIDYIDNLEMTKNAK